MQVNSNASPTACLTSRCGRCTRCDDSAYGLKIYVDKGCNWSSQRLPSYIHALCLNKYKLHCYPRNPGVHWNHQGNHMKVSPSLVKMLMYTLSLLKQFLGYDKLTRACVAYSLTRRDNIKSSDRSVKEIRKAVSI